MYVSAWWWGWKPDEEAEVWSVIEELFKFIVTQ